MSTNTSASPRQISDSMQPPVCWQRSPKFVTWSRQAVDEVNAYRQPTSKSIETVVICLLIKFTKKTRLVMTWWLCRRSDYRQRPARRYQCCGDTISIRYTVCNFDGRWRWRCASADWMNCTSQFSDSDAAVVRCTAHSFGAIFADGYAWFKDTVVPSTAASYSTVARRQLPVSLHCRDPT